MLCFGSKPHIVFLGSQLRSNNNLIATHPAHNEKTHLRRRRPKKWGQCVIHHYTVMRRIKLLVGYILIIIDTDKLVQFVSIRREFKWWWLEAGWLIGRRGMVIFRDFKSAGLDIYMIQSDCLTMTHYVKGLSGEAIIGEPHLIHEKWKWFLWPRRTPFATPIIASGQKLLLQLVIGVW